MRFFRTREAAKKHKEEQEKKTRKKHSIIEIQTEPKLKDKQDIEGGRPRGWREGWSDPDEIDYRQIDINDLGQFNFITQLKSGRWEWMDAAPGQPGPISRVFHGPNAPPNPRGWEGDAWGVYEGDPMYDDGTEPAE
jgi:hypothetical protein